MKKWIVAGLIVLIAVWWVAAAPRSEITIADAVTFDPSTAQAIAAVDRSAEFAAGLERFPSNLPHFDDAVLVDEGKTALVTVTDGQIWSVDLATHAAQPFADPPLMAYGIHEAPGDPNHVCYCSSRSYGAPQPDQKVGLYRLALDDRSIEPIVVDVPAINLAGEQPVVCGDDDPKAPEWQRDGAAARAARSSSATTSRSARTAAASTFRNRPSAASSRRPAHRCPRRQSRRQNPVVLDDV